MRAQGRFHWRMNPFFLGSGGVFGGGGSGDEVVVFCLRWLTIWRCDARDGGVKRSDKAGTPGDVVDWIEDGSASETKGPPGWIEGRK